MFRVLQREAALWGTEGAAAGHSGKTGNLTPYRDFGPWGPDSSEANPRCSDSRPLTAVSDMVEVVLSGWTTLALCSHFPAAPSSSFPNMQQRACSLVSFKEEVGVEEEGLGWWSPLPGRLHLGELPTGLHLKSQGMPATGGESHLWRSQGKC